jgi:hypothetical protein
MPSVAPPGCRSESFKMRELASFLVVLSVPFPSYAGVLKIGCWTKPFYGQPTAHVCTARPVVTLLFSAGLRAGSSFRLWKQQV